MVIENGQKKPAIRNYKNLGPAGSTKLRDQFIEADALGFVAGPKNGVTTIDVDTSSEGVLADMLARCGESPFIVRTPSGGYHALYENSGEDRRIRPWPGMPVDVLGGGLVVAAPSLVPGGGYEIIQGSFEDLARLPRIRGLDDLKLAEDSSRKIPHGKRNDMMFRYLMRQAHHCPDLDSLVDMAMTYREERCERDPTDPFTDAEVRKTAKSVWWYTARGLNRFKPHGHIPVPAQPQQAPSRTALYRDPLACTILTYLQDHYASAPKFIVPNALHRKFGVSRPTFANARNRLEELGFIRMIRRPSETSGPAVYAWPAGCQ